MSERRWKVGKGLIESPAEIEVGEGGGKGRERIVVDRREREFPDSGV